MNLTRKQVREIEARRPGTITLKPAVVPPAFKDEYDSSWERLYNAYLQGQLSSGIITWFWYHPFRIVLQAKPRIQYEPDFLVLLPGGDYEVHEVKGHFREKDKIRFKLAVAKFPQWKFYIVQREEGAWNLTQPWEV